MKHLFLTLLLLAPFSLLAQKNEETKNIDAQVAKIDKSASATLLQLQTSGKNYTYALTHGKVIFLSVKYKIDSADYEEKYYFIKENLAYAEIRETTYYNKEPITWGGQFYFSNYKLIYYETLGHGRSEKDDWKPEKEVLKKFDLRINELKAKINKLDMLRYAIIIEKANGGYGAYVPDLPGCVGMGSTHEEVLQNITEAIKFHLDGMKEEKIPLPDSNSEAINIFLDYSL